jgi:hypothetical protein
MPPPRPFWKQKAAVAKSLSELDLYAAVLPFPRAPARQQDARRGRSFVRVRLRAIAPEPHPASRTRARGCFGR